MLNCLRIFHCLVLGPRSPLTGWAAEDVLAHGTLLASFWFFAFSLLLVRPLACCLCQRYYRLVWFDVSASRRQQIFDRLSPCKLQQ